MVGLACIIHEDSAPRVNSAKQVALSPEKRGPLRAEGDRVRCDALLALASNRQSAIFRFEHKFTASAANKDIRAKSTGRLMNNAD